MALTTHGAAYLAAAVHRHLTHLSHVFERAELHRLEREFAVLKAEQLVVRQRLLLLSECPQRQFDVTINFTAKLARLDALINLRFNFPQLFLVLDHQLLEDISLAEWFLKERWRL